MESPGLSETIDELREREERLRAAMRAFFTPDRTKSLADKIEDLQRAYEQEGPK